MLSSIGIPRSSIEVSQQSIDVAMNNIANEATPGYKKRTVVTSELIKDGYQSGAGVQIDRITRTINDGLNNEVLKSNGKYNYLQTQRDLFEPLSTVNEGVLSEDYLGSVTNTLHSLSNSPTDPNLRADLQSSVELFAYSINKFLDVIDSANVNAVNDANTSVSEINRLTEEIANINNAIGFQDKEPLDLLDRRDALEKELSGYIQFTASVNNGLYTLSIAGTSEEIVVGANTRKLSIVESTQTLQYQKDANSTSYDYNIQNATLRISSSLGMNGDTKEIDISDMNSGQLAAQLDYTKEGSTLDDIKLSFMSYVANMRDDIMSKTNSSDENLKLFGIDFTQGTNDGNEEGKYITVSHIDDFNVTDSKVMSEIVSYLNQDKSSIYGISDKMTLNEQESYIRAKIHAIANNHDVVVDIEERTLKMFEDEYANLTQVDTTEEMMDVMKFQATYQASAKMIQVIDEMIQTILGIKR